MDHFVTAWASDSDVPSTSETTSDRAESEANAPNISHATIAADLAATGKQKKEKTWKSLMQFV